MPIKTHIVDLRKEFAAGNRSIFSRLLMTKIEDALAHKKQIILFLNKRGFSSSLTCRECGFTMKCENCDVAMTYHKESHKRTYMLCHYCGARQKTHMKCPECRSPYIRFFGIGTQQITEIVQEILPKARIARADRDTTRTKQAFEKIYHDLKDGKIDILVGTQIIAKGLDIENVALIGVMLADVGFHIPDFRSSERVFQLLTQVSGRTGRLGKKGEVVIQTYLPDQPAIQLASEEAYKDFYTHEVSEREKFQYPPFSKLIKLIFVHKDSKKCYNEAKYMYEQIKWNLKNKKELQGQDIEAYLSLPLISKLHNKYHYHILLKGKNPRKLFDHMELRRGWRIDVDPVSLV